MHLAYSQGRVFAVSLSQAHTFAKSNQSEIRLLAGLGVEGDAHCGTTVKHRSRVAKDPTQPNLRQVHLIHYELHADLEKKGMPLSPGQIGENITTQGINLLDLPKGTLLQLGKEAVIEVTGLRNPCAQLNGIHKGLLDAVLDRDAAGNLVRKAGIMAIVVTGGVVRPGDAIQVTLPGGEWVGLAPV